MHPYCNQGICGISGMLGGFRKNAAWVSILSVLFLLYRNTLMENFLIIKIINKKMDSGVYH